MFKNIVFLVFLSLSMLQMSCSSKTAGGGDGDLDISEIKEIESTGEFSEDEFFSDNELVAGADDEGKLIEVPGDEIAGGAAATEIDATDGTLDLEILEDGEADLLADADLDIANEFEVGEGEVSTDLAEDSGALATDELDAAVDDEPISDSIKTDDLAFDDIPKENMDELLLEEDGSSDDFGEFEDTASVAPIDDGSTGDNVTIDAGEMDDLIASDFGEDETTAPDLPAQEEVTVDNTDIAALEPEAPATEELKEESFEIKNDFSDFEDEPVVDNTVAASDILDGEDISFESDFSDIDTPTSVSSGPTYDDTIASTPDFGGDTSSASVTTPVAKKAPIPVKKMKTVPFEKNGILANSIYFVRSGDSLSNIANKIYGSGSAVDFTIVNPHLRPGSLRVGQKVYYNSPRRPQDRSRLITFYEDTGLPAQYYQASSGENIRKVSKDLLGHSRSWMEIWASNQDIVSKGNLDANYSVRYWMGTDSPSPAVLASNKPTNTYKPTPAASAPVARNNTPAPRASNTRNSLEAEIEMDQRIENNQASLKDEFDEPELEDFDEPEVAVNNAQKPRVVNNPVVNNNNNRPNVAASGSVNQANKNDNGFVDLEDEIDFSKDDVSPAGNVAARGNAPKSRNTINPEKPRDIAKRPPFPVSRRRGALSKSMIESIALGAGGLLLLLAVILIVRKKRKRAEAIQMDSFDFGGETTIENEQTKTQIDI